MATKAATAAATAATATATATTTTTTTAATPTSSHRSPAIAAERFHTLPREGATTERYVSLATEQAELPATARDARVCDGEKVNLTLTGAHAGRVPKTLHK